LNQGQPAGTHIKTVFRTLDPVGVRSPEFHLNLVLHPFAVGNINKIQSGIGAVREKTEFIGGKASSIYIRQVKPNGLITVL